MANQEYLIIEHLSIKEIGCVFSHIKVTATGCWEWQAGRSGKYGKVKFRQRTELAHRLLYAWTVEPIPKRVKGEKTPQLDHLVCDNPICCNPSHVKLVAPRDNSLRSPYAPAGINARKTHCPKGHPLPASRDCLQCHRDRYHNESPEQRERRKRRVAADYQRYKNGPNRETFLRRRTEANKAWIHRQRTAKG